MTKDSTELKQALGKEIATLAKDNQVIALGTGSTVDKGIEELGAVIASSGITLYGISTSLNTTRKAISAGIHVLDLDSNPKIDWGFDGADELTKELTAIKGGGAAMYAEKCLALRCPHWILIADHSKLSDQLGSKPIPLEIEASQLQYIIENLPPSIESYSIREGSGSYGPVYTSRGNIVVDLMCNNVNGELALELSALHGVLGHGLFLTEAHEAWIAEASGEITKYKRH